MAFKEPTTEEWKKQVALALEYQSERNRLESWKQARQYYMNEYPESVVSVNLIFAIGRSLVPQLYFKTPTVLVQPDKEEAVKMAPVLEAIDRKLVTQMHMKQQMKLGILDAFVSNIAVFKFGYHSIATKVDAQEGNGSLVGDLLKANPELMGAETEDENLQTYSYHDSIRPDAPWMLRINPEDFLVPYGTLNIESAPWCAFRVIRLLEDVKNDPTYKNTADLTASTTLVPDGKNPVKATNPTLQGQDLSGGEKLNAVELYEIWDKRSGKIIVIQMDTEHPLRDEEHNMPIQGLPVELLQFNPTGWDFWGPTDVEQIVQQQIEVNETRTLELQHKRTATAKFLVDEGLVDDTELTKFVKGQLSVIKVKGNPNNAIRELNPTMSRDLYNISDVIRADISEILGFSRNQAGEFDVSRRTATEAGIVQKALEIRSDERRDQVADLIARAFQRKINPLIFQQWTAQRSIEVTGKVGWVQYTGAQIKGDYTVSVVADSVVPLSMQQRQQSAMLALERFADNPRINQTRLYEWALAQFQSLGVPADLLLSEEEFQGQQRQQMMQALLTQMQGQKGGQGNGQA